MPATQEAPRCFVYGKKEGDKFQVDMGEGGTYSVKIRELSQSALGALGHVSNNPAQCSIGRCLNDVQEYPDADGPAYINCQACGNHGTVSIRRRNK